MAEEFLYASEYACEDERSAAIAVWNIYYNYHRPPQRRGRTPAGIAANDWAGGLVVQSVPRLTHRRSAEGRQPRAEHPLTMAPRDVQAPEAGGGRLMRRRRRFGDYPCTGPGPLDRVG